MKNRILLLLLVPLYLFSQEIDTFTDSRDGKVYKIIKIGEQWWMAENFKFWVPKDSPHYKGRSTFYGWEDENAHRYGRLYSWDMAIAVCPEGWHLPDREEWQSLINSFGELYDVNGNIPKKSEVSKERWKKIKLLRKEIFTSLQEGNSSGFDVLYGGYHHKGSPPFSGLGTIAKFWTSDDNVDKGMFKKSAAWGFHVGKWEKKFHEIPALKNTQCSVRYVKNK